MLDLTVIDLSDDLTKLIQSDLTILDEFGRAFDVSQSTIVFFSSLDVGRSVVMVLSDFPRKSERSWEHSYSFYTFQSRDFNGRC